MPLSVVEAEEASAALVEHCYYCFQVIIARLKGRPEPKDTPFHDNGDEFPLFVTWNMYPSSSSSSRLFSSSSSSPRLRGCIGTFEPYPLTAGLAEYAVISAFKDHRFSPISLAELPRLECGVSLLTAFEDCDDYLDWQVGIHGIYIHLPNPALAPSSSPSGESSSSASASSTPAPTNRKSAKSSLYSGSTFLTATYLPDVMPAQGWTKEEAIDSAIRKAGWNGKITAQIRRSLRVQRYRSEKVDCSYNDFVEWQQRNGHSILV